MRPFVITLVVLFFLSATVMADECTDAVLAFYPPDLQTSIDSYAAHGGDPGRRICTQATVTLDGPHTTPYIVAAFTNTFDAAVRVIKPVSGELRGAGVATGSQLSGIWPRLSAIDVDGDGKPEILLCITGEKRSCRTWILAWDGANLNSIGPDSNDEIRTHSTVLTDPALRDIDGDGRLEIIDGAAGRPQWVYHLDNGKYSFQKHILFYGIFARHPGMPAPFTLKFSSDDASEHTLTIMNGEQNGSHRAASAVITVNGMDVVKPSDLNENVYRIVKTMTTSSTNRITAEVRGEPDAIIFVAVE